MTTTISGGTYITGDFLLSHDTRAYATATITGGAVSAITVTSGGEGYTSPPAVTITGDGTGAAATSIITNGIVTGFTITSGGSGYTFASVSIAAPASVSSRIVLIPQTPYDMWGGGVAASFDDGSSWQTIGDLPGFSRGSGWRTAAFDGSTMYTFGRPNGDNVFISSDGGNTWTQSQQLPTSDTNGILGVGNGRLLLARSDEVFISTNNGTTWDPSGPYSLQQAIGTSGSLIYAAGRFVLASGNSIQVSTDNGETWTLPATSTVAGTYINVVYGAGVLVAASASGLRYSTDNGQTWTAVSSGPTTSQSQAVAYGAGKFLTVDNSYNIWTSTDGMAWTDSGSDFPSGSVVPLASTLTYSGGYFYAWWIVGSGSTATDVQRSESGTDWSSSYLNPFSGASGIPRAVFTF